jgi:hypothetical protein
MRIGYETVQRYQSALRDNGFERVEFRDRQLFWKEIGPDGKHIVIETIGGTTLQVPDWRKKFAQISIHDGPDLCDQLLHQEVAYTLEDLLEFMKDLKEGKFNDF